MSEAGSAKAVATADARGVYRRLLGYIKPHRGAFALGILGGVLYAATMVSFAAFIKELFDNTFTARDPRTITWVPIALIALFFLRGLGDFTQTYFMGYVSRHIVKRLRRQVFERFLELPVRYFDRGSSGSLLSRLTFNTEQVGNAATDSVTVLVRETLSIIGSVAYIIYLNWKLALIALTMGPLIAWLVSVINKYFRRYSRRIQDSMGDVTRVAKETLEAPRVIKVYNAEQYQSRLFESVNERNRRSNMRLILTRGLSNPVIQLISSFALAVVLSIAISQAIHHELTMGALAGFFAGLVNIAQPLRSLVNVAGPMQQGIAAAQNIFELLDEPVEDPGRGRSAGQVRGNVEFDSVSFAYGTEKGPALSGISFTVGAGENIAIVGRSGSGKSTLVNLLPRFYDATAGAVRLDGYDVRDYDLRSLRSRIALVTQDVVLFNDTIRNNIAFGQEASAEAIERAAAAAHVIEFTRGLPEGMDTVVGDRGVTLSGGQRQRIAIARALLKDAPILILDEATSALDTESERIIQAALERLMQHRTTLVIAHRLSTVEKADRIVVMDAGRLVEMGTHAELLVRGGLYAQLHRMQFTD